MQTVNNLLFDSTAALNGKWRNIGNFVGASVHGVNLEGNVWIELSNDPNVMVDGTSNLSAPSAPTLSQFTFNPPVAGGGGYDDNPAGRPFLTGQGTLYVVVTYVTPWGETTASPEASLAMLDNNVLVVQSPPRDAGGIATGYNVYIGQASGREVLQTMPPFTPAASAALPYGPTGYSYATSGVLPIGTNFFLTGGYQNTTVGVPSTNTAGGLGTGVIAYYLWKNSASGPAPGPFGATGEEGVYSDSNNGGQTIWAPSCLYFNFIRIAKDSTANTKETKVYLFGMNG
jgi:hypothetical protein